MDESLIRITPLHRTFARFCPDPRILLPLLICVVGCATPTERFGPIAVRNQHPVQLTGLRLEPTSARPMSTGALDVGLHLAYSNMQLASNRNGNSFTMDGEILRTALHGTYAPLRGLELRIDLPFAHSSGGFLDQFVEGFHDTFELENGNRGVLPRNRFLVGAVQNGDQLYRMEKRTFTLLDVPIEAQWNVLSHRGPVELDVAVRGAIELPTGSQDDGYGNGGLDYAIGAVGEVAWGPLSFNAHIGHAFIHTPDRAAAHGFDYRDSMSSGFGLEAALTADTAAIFQVEMDQSILRELVGVHTEADQWMLWLGLRSRLTEGTLFEFSFGEDLTLNGPPDFTVYMGFRSQFAGPTNGR